MLQRLPTAVGSGFIRASPLKTAACFGWKQGWCVIKTNIMSSKEVIAHGGGSWGTLQKEVIILYFCFHQKHISRYSFRLIIASKIAAAWSHRWQHRVITLMLESWVKVWLSLPSLSVALFVCLVHSSMWGYHHGNILPTHTVWQPLLWPAVLFLQHNASFQRKR